MYRLLLPILIVSLLVPGVFLSGCQLLKTPDALTGAGPVEQDADMDAQESGALPGYTRRIRANCMETCPTRCAEKMAEQFNADNRDFCQRSCDCSYTNISRKIPLADYLDFDEGDPDPNIDAIFKACSKHNLEYIQR